jgi:transposase
MLRGLRRPGVLRADWVLPTHKKSMRGSSRGAGCQNWSFDRRVPPPTSFRGVRQFLDTIDAAVPKRFDVHFGLDNYGTHKIPIIHRWLVKRPRFHLHFTPTGTSWINQVERWFALLTEKRLRRSAFRSTRELETAIRQYIHDHNQQPRPFHWTKTADQILANVARFCTRTSETGDWVD